MELSGVLMKGTLILIQGKGPHGNHINDEIQLN